MVGGYSSDALYLAAGADWGWSSIGGLRRSDESGDRERAAWGGSEDPEVFAALGVPKKFFVDCIAEYVVFFPPPVLRVVVNGGDGKSQTAQERHETVRTVLGSRE